MRRQYGSAGDPPAIRPGSGETSRARRGRRADEAGSAAGARPTRSAGRAVRPTPAVGSDRGGRAGGRLAGRSKREVPDAGIVFVPSEWQAVLRILVVGTGGVATLIALMRLAGPRTLGQMDEYDLVITVAIGSSFGRILTAHTVGAVEAIAGFALLIGLQYAIGWMRVSSTRAERLVSGGPHIVFYKGVFQREAMKRARITEAEILGAVRQSGAGSLGRVEAVVLEANGHLASVGTVGDGSAMPEHAA